MSRELVIATGNPGKVAEFTSALAGLPVAVSPLAAFGDIPEAVENGDSFTANAILKATHYAVHTRRACLADDSGLEVDALDGAPGVHSARYAGPDGDAAACNAKLLAALENVPAERRTGRFRCVLAYVDPDGTLITAEGACEGLILTAPRGSGGFGYDPLFYLPGLGRTMAELTLAEKNAVSHRGQALRNLTLKLARFFDENRRD